jgi:hypothetical protein
MKIIGLKIIKVILLIGLIINSSFVEAKIESRDLQKKHQETPNERFFRKGGKSTPAKVIYTKEKYYTTEDIIQHRDLSLYESAGPYDGGYFPMFHNEDPQQAIDLQATAREFVWQHWKEKKRAYLIITFHSVDATSTTHLFIEPDDLGVWSISRRIVRHHGEIDDLPKTFSVQRINLKDKNNSKIISVDSTPDPKSYVLLFIDKDGESNGNL